MKIILLFLFCLFSFVLAEQVTPKEVTNYNVLHQSITYENQNYTILRSFIQENESYFLIVNEKSLKTKIIKQELLRNKIQNTPHQSRYNDILNQYNNAPYPIYNYGLKHIDTQNTYLTIDMCPSSKVGYERAFFKELIDKYYKGKAIALTIFVSGKWIEKHQKNFLELLELQKSGFLDITWGNHTFSHPYNKKLENEKNFLLMPKVDVEKEILENEKLLLSYGIAPTIVLRFPGLISNEKVVKTIKALGLISVGTDTWMNKSEHIHNGSIILIHGNKNEPHGIKRANDELLEHNNFFLGSLLDDI